MRVAHEFKIFTNVNNAIVDPKAFDDRSFVDYEGDVCIVPPNSFALARSVEYFRIPRSVITLCVGKSTYARCGIITNVTPFEPEWEGYVTLEISNTTPLPARIYANEGIAQVIFFESESRARPATRTARGSTRARWESPRPSFERGAGIAFAPHPMTRDADASAPPFNAATRAANWATIADEEFDLLVVGAGITGCGIALDAAGRGLRVALVDAGDFAFGTSSRSSRLIHGGLRYLESFDFRLVFEALAERRRLLELAPHLVRPLPFLFPVHRGVGPNRARLAAGMWLYDTLSLFRGVRRHRMLGREGAIEHEPRLRSEGLRGGAIYFDAQVDDARLTLAVARAAHEAGATALPHARVTEFVTDDGGSIRGAVLRDGLSGEVREVRARLVVSAAGPWTDELRRLADPAAQPRLRITKGVHIVLPSGRVGNRGAIIFPSALDGRVMFVLPWRDLTYVGTTDTDFAGDAVEPPPERDDVDYLLASANHLFPEARLTREDVVSTWAGVRPLLAPRRASRGDTTGRTSREHEIWRDGSGLLCVAGGKLTTYRPMAAETARRAAAILRAEHGVESGDFYTEHVRLPGAPDREWDHFREAIGSRAEACGLDAETAEHLAFAYGEDAFEVLARVEEDPRLGDRLMDDLPYIAAEVDHVIATEMPLTVEDVLRRRLHVTYESADAGLALVERVAERLRTANDLPHAELDRQREEYEHTARLLLSFRTG